MKRSMRGVAIAALLMSVSASASADALELEGAVSGMGSTLTPALRLGFVLGDHATLGLGVMAFGVREQSEGGYSSGFGGIAVPLDLKIWILAPRPGQVSPTARLVVQAIRQFDDFGSANGLGGGLLFGAAYQFDETIGVSIEGGGSYIHLWQESEGFSDETRIWDVNYRLSLVMRI